MNLYESLVKNIGIGLEPLNKKYIQSVFNKPTTQQWVMAFCNRYGLTPSISDSREIFKGTDSQKVHAAWVDYGPDNITYEISFRKKDVEYIDELITVGEEGISIINDIKNYKKYYDKLDKLFKKHLIVTKEDYFNVRNYLWTDCRYSIEELMHNNELQKQLNESLVNNVGIGQKRVYEYNKNLILNLFKNDDYELFDKILKNLKLDILDKKLVTKIADRLNEKSDFYLNYYPNSVYDKDINHNVYFAQIGADMWIGSRQVYQKILVIDWDKLAVIDDLPELKDAYKFLDRNFGAYKEYMWDWFNAQYTNNKRYNTYQMRMYKLENAKIPLDQ